MTQIWRPPQTLPRGGPGREIFNDVFGSYPSSQAAFELIEKGVSTSAVEAFLRTFSMSLNVLSVVLDLSERTLARRRSEGKLKRDEGDRFYRLVALYAKAADVLDGVDAAEEWMTSPALALGNKTPLEYTVNEAGAERVETLLTRIEHAVYT